MEKTEQTTSIKRLLDEGFVISRIIKVEGYQPKPKAEAEADNPYTDGIQHKVHEVDTIIRGLEMIIVY